MPDAWSVVLGDYDRHIESGYEQRIAIDRIVMHDNYENYQHDVVLMRLARPANIQSDALARKICLPFKATSSSSSNSGGDSSVEEPSNGGAGAGVGDVGDDAFDGNSNQLRKLQIQRNGGQSRRRNDKFIKDRSAFNRVEDGRKKYVTNYNQYHFAFDKPAEASHHDRQQQAKSKVNVSTKRV